ncbi:integrin alpha-3 [Elysia marginata]|uniref:Integrin alpha-3 n=1 Tax=Elysia marginata TaxID=1093978 RepID=A0AAV4EC34_9GAST|nr:integrin alpha-3 [Elysia marginata]
MVYQKVLVCCASLQTRNWPRRMLIGAPYEKREVLGKTVGGSIYKCKVSAEKDDCELITATDPLTHRSTELLEDQWLGVVVASAGRNKKAVVIIEHHITHTPLIL